MVNAPSTYRGTELARILSTATPATGDLILTDEGRAARGDGTNIPLELPDATSWPTAGALSNIRKAADGVFNVMLLGTSKQTFDSSPCQVFVQHLKNLYGDANSFQFRPGIAGGSFTSTFSGWTHQRYGGPFQYRLRGDSTATPITQTVYGDTVTLEFSIETDAAAASVTIDGTQVGSTPTGSAQAYSQKQTFTLGSADIHTITVGVPSGAGAVYWEHLTVTTATARGIDARDATLGGSLFSNQITVAGAITGQTASIPIVGDNGLNAVFNRPEVDLFVMGYLVNDAGWQSSSLTNYTGYWRTGMDKVAAITAATGAKLILIIETAGHYVMPNDGGTPWNHRQYMAMADYYRYLSKRWPHITVVDHQGAIKPASYSQADLQAWADRYFPLAGTLNVAAGSYSGSDFIHEVPSAPTTETAYLSNQAGTIALCRAVGIHPPTRPMATWLAADRIRQMLAGYRDVTAVIASGAVKKVPVANGGAFQARSAAGTSGMGGYGFQGSYLPYVRDAAATNLTGAASAQTAIDASSTIDATYGPYLTMSLYGVNLGTNVAVGARLTLTIRARGAIKVRAQGGAMLYSSYTGSQIPQTDTVNGRTELNYSVTGSDPAVFSVVIGATATGGTVYLSGDVFEVSLVDASIPCLLKYAPPLTQGAKGDRGPTGPTGGAASTLLSGYYSNPTGFGPLSTSALTVGNEYFIPFVPQVSGTVTGLAIGVTTAGIGAVLRLGLYSADATTGRPATLLAEGSTTIDASTIGGKTTAFTTGVAVTAGTVYWLAACAQVAACTVRTLTGTNPLIVATVTDLTAAASYFVTGQTGALPTAITAGFFSTNSFGTFAPFVRALVQ